MREKQQTMEVLPPHFTLCQYMALQSILHCSPTITLINILSFHEINPFMIANYRVSH